MHLHWVQVGRMNDVQAFSLEEGVKSLSEFSIIIVDQETLRSIPVIEFLYQLPGLLGDPDLVRIGCCASQMHSACTQFDEEEHI